MTSEYLEIPVAGKRGSVKLVVYPQSSKAKVFEEQEPYAGESRYQLVEGGTYTYEFIGGRYQFGKENEIVRFHPNKLHHVSEGTLTTGIYVGHLTLDVVEIDTHEQTGRVRYPGEENRELRGFHEIVPGLGAFSIRPGHWLQDSAYLKQFLAEVKAHLLDRTSDREKLSYYEYDVHLAANESMTMESLPEAEGENRGFLPDETTVLIGYYKSKEHLEWIMKHWLYNGRAGDRKGTLSVNKEIVTARYILLHNGHEAMLQKINLGGPKVYGFKEMKELDYPFNPNDNNEDKIYLMFRLNQKGIEKELQKYTWDPHNLKKLKLNRFGRLDVVGLTELIKVAKTI